MEYSKLVGTKGKWANMRMRTQVCSKALQWASRQNEVESKVS